MSKNTLYDLNSQNAEKQIETQRVIQKDLSKRLAKIVKILGTLNEEYLVRQFRQPDNPFLASLEQCISNLQLSQTKPGAQFKRKDRPRAGHIRVQKRNGLASKLKLKQENRSKYKSYSKMNKAKNNVLVRKKGQSQKRVVTGKQRNLMLKLKQGGQPRGGKKMLIKKGTVKIKKQGLTIKSSLTEKNKIRGNTLISKLNNNKGKTQAPGQQNRLSNVIKKNQKSSYRKNGFLKKKSQLPQLKKVKVKRV